MAIIGLEEVVLPNPSRVEGVVRSISAYGRGTYHVSIEVPPRFTRFAPGQFLHLALDPFDQTSGFWPESRVFSIASAPRVGLIEIVYSVKGTFTKRMEAELTVERPVWLKLPYGDFVISEDLLDQGPLILIAGGTGLAPYRPFLLQEGLRGRVHLFYGVRTPDQILFGGDWERLSSLPWFTYHLWVEAGSVAGENVGRGRLSIEKVLETIGPECEGARYFLSGPPLMIRSFRDTLLASGIERDRIHIDEWE